MFFAQVWPPRSVQYNIDETECVHEGVVEDLEVSFEDDASSSESDEEIESCHDEHAGEDDMVQFIPRIQTPGFVALWRKEAAKLEQELARISRSLRLPDWRHNLIHNKMILCSLLDEEEWRHCFDALQKDIEHHLSLIMTYESRVSSECNLEISRYTNLQSRLKELSSLHEKHSNSIATSAENLLFLTDACQAKEAEVEEKKCELVDSQALVRIRHALQQLKTVG